MITITKTQSAATADHAKRFKVHPWMVTAVGSVLVSGLAFFLVVSPQWKRVGPGMELDVAAAEQDLAVKQRTLDNLQELHKNYQAIDQTNIELLSRMLPRGKSIPELMHQLETMARQSGVSLTDVNISAIEDDRTTAQQRSNANNIAVKRLLVQMQVSAYSYPSFRAFLEGLQSHTRLLDVDSFIFSTEKDTQQLSVSAYYIP